MSNTFSQKYFSRRRSMNPWACGLVLKHSLASESELRRRCLINREPVYRVAEQLGLDAEQARGAVRLLKECRVSRKRLACVAMMDPGLEDEDIAEMFGEPVSWATGVRKNIKRLKRNEPIPAHLEYLDDGLCHGDPSPSEILERAADIRSRRAADEQDKPKRIKYWRATVPQRPAPRAGGGTQVGRRDPVWRQMRLPWEEAGDTES